MLPPLLSSLIDIDNVANLVQTFFALAVIVIVNDNKLIQSLLMNGRILRGIFVLSGILQMVRYQLSFYHHFVLSHLSHLLAVPEYMIVFKVDVLGEQFRETTFHRISCILVAMLDLGLNIPLFSWSFQIKRHPGTWCFVSENSTSNDVPDLSVQFTAWGDYFSNFTVVYYFVLLDFVLIAHSVFAIGKLIKILEAAKKPFFYLTFCIA